MSATPIVLSEPAGSRDNEIRPFQIDGMDVRGRAVRLGTAIDKILKTQDYPDPVARILGELISLAVLIGSALKFNGIVTVQTKSRGPIPMMVADYEQQQGQPGRLRGYAQIDREQLSQYGKNPSFHGLIGSKTGGYMALTIDQGSDMERYQGIVELSGKSLSDVAENYFINSEQIPTGLRLACERDDVTQNWRAGAIMVQYLPKGEEKGPRLPQSEDRREDWRRARTLMESVKTSELTDPQLTLDTLLFRLYHEDGVRVFAPEHAEFGCRCSREKIETMLQGFNKDDIDHMTIDGKISVDCHFCATSHIFDPAKLKAD